jgi:hypothetical protein
MENVAISLGNTCSSAQWALEKKLRKSKENGYLTCPFDLMVSNYKGVVECIKTDFLDFTNPKFLVLNSNGIFNVKYNFGFNHESPGHANLYLHENWPEGTNHFVNNNYKHFIDRYNKRIESFINYLKNPNNFIIFVLEFNNEKNPNNGFYELREVLKVKYPNLKYVIYHDIK